MKHILLPTDLGPRAHTALKHALKLAHADQAKITLLNIHREFMSENDMEMLRVSVESVTKQFRETALKSRAAMKAEVQALGGDDLEIQYLLRDGDPRQVIPKVAGELAADLIVMCSDGKDNIQDWIRGTITEQVINHAPCPVLVILNKG